MNNTANKTSNVKAVSEIETRSKADEKADEDERALIIDRFSDSSRGTGRDY